MQSCLRETAFTGESHSCYLIIEEVEESGSRRVAFAGGGNISIWKEKLKKEPSAFRYDTTQFLMVKNDKHPHIEISNFQLKREDNYQSLSNTRTSTIPFDTTSRNFLEGMISIKKDKLE